MDQLAQYLKSIRDEYAYVKDVYAPTDVSGDVTDSAALSSHSLQLEFMVQTATEKGAATKDLAVAQRTEKLNALEALKKYAPRHVLLKGRPGSGKTTVLKRLLLESADQALDQESASANIPIFLELKHYQTSFIDLIRNFMMHHGWLTDKAEVEKLLLEGRMLLLVDGINELPSESARRDLQSFRTAYLAKTPMICTTREIGVGADLETAQELEMLPLTDTQVERFARAYLHEKADGMLQRLSGRLKDLVRTPLLLWMLCLVFAEKNETPLSIGAVFRRFTQTYGQTFKGDPRVTDESRRLWPDLLAYLAFCMIQGHEMAVAIPRQLGQQIIAEYLETRGVDSSASRAAAYLSDLINHHLLEMTREGSIQFVHQLVQEYFAAEYLLNSFPAINDEQLKRDYLNYRKWTGPVFLMLGLIDDLNEALRLVRLGLAVDPMLGARLAGAAREEFLEETIKQVLQCDVPKKIKIELLGSTRSQEAISLVVGGLHDEDEEVRSTVVRNLARIGGATATASLLDALKDEDKRVRADAAWGLGRIGGEQASEALIDASKHNDEAVRMVIALALSQISGNIAQQRLIDALTDSNPSVASTAALALGKIGDNRATYQLVEALKYGADDVSTSAAVALRDLRCWWATEEIAHALRSDNPAVSGRAAWVLTKIGGDKATVALIDVLTDSNPSMVRAAAWALGKIGDRGASEALIDALKHEDKGVRLDAAWALGEIGDDRATEALIDILKDDDSFVRNGATVALVRIGGDRGKEVAISLLRHDDLQMRFSAAFALGMFGDGHATEALVDALKDENKQVRFHAALALGEIGDGGATEALIDTLLDKESSVRSSVAEALGKIGGAESTAALIGMLEDRESSVRGSVAKALGKIGGAKSTAALIEALTDKDEKVRTSAAAALGEIGDRESIEPIMHLVLSDDRVDLLQPLSRIQGRCQCYSDILFVHVHTPSPLRSNEFELYAVTEEAEIRTLISVESADTRFYLLHLSDLHFSGNWHRTDQDATVWFGQLILDIQKELSCPRIDALVLSGDIANRASIEEYSGAQRFLEKLTAKYDIRPKQILIVPGNHDVDWHQSRAAYQLIWEDEYCGSKDPEICHDRGDGILTVLDQSKYPHRFESFSHFYEGIKGEPFPMDYELQVLFNHFSDQKLLIMGLNSAWQTDHLNKAKAGINPLALSHAVDAILEKYDDCTKVAVWHHPLKSHGEDRIKQDDFMEQLAVAGFRLALHGHVHKADGDLYRYDHSPKGRKIEIVGAGTFGAHTRELVPGYPWQYNLMIIDKDKVVVKTRKREKPNGTWKPDARWLCGPGEDPRSYYEIDLRA